MKKIFFLLVVIFNFQLKSHDLQPVITKLQDYIKQTMPEWGVPGAAVVIVKDGQVIYCGCFGTKMLGTDDQIDQHTVFQVASLSKLFTATLAGILQEKGFFNLDDPVVKYLPNFKLSNPEVTQKVTIRDLISHRIGLKHFTGDSVWSLGFSEEELMQFLSKMPFSNRFREDFGYQNCIFSLIGPVMKKATGKEYSQLIEEFLIKPLDLKDCSASPNILPSNQSWWHQLGVWLKLIKPANVAVPHDIDEMQKTRVLGFDKKMYSFPATSGINISAHDLGKFMIMLLNQGVYQGHSVVPSKHIQQMQSNHVRIIRKDTDLQFPPTYFYDNSYGMGGFNYNYAKKINGFSQMGGYLGIRALVTIMPNESLAIGILSNLGAVRVSLFPEAIRNKFLDLYLNLPRVDWSKDLLSSMRKIRKKVHGYTYDISNPEPMTDAPIYEGVYHNEAYGNIKIKSQGQNLSFSYRDINIPLKHLNGDSFIFPGTLLSKAYSGIDVGTVQFGRNLQKKKILQINLMGEYMDGIFTEILP